ncbi:unnamed protein product [Sympodiomycopsis kandeliae]
MKAGCKERSRALALLVFLLTAMALSVAAAPVPASIPFEDRDEVPTATTFGRDAVIAGREVSTFQARGGGGCLGGCFGGGGGSHNNRPQGQSATGGQSQASSSRLPSKERPPETSHSSPPYPQRVWTGHKPVDLKKWAPHPDAAPVPASVHTHKSALDNGRKNPFKGMAGDLLGCVLCKGGHSHSH